MVACIPKNTNCKTQSREVREFLSKFTFDAELLQPTIILFDRDKISLYDLKLVLLFVRVHGRQCDR